MMLSHPVLLGILWSLLFLETSGQSQISNNESNKVYAYSYHFQHNGTTNSKDILRSVLGTDPDFGFDNADEKSIVKTFSSPGIRGFFTKGVLPAGPISHSFNNGINSPFSAVKKFVESNIQPPRNIAKDILPPISPDMSRDFPGDFNSVNNIGNVFQDDFPKIPPPPPPARISNNIGNRNVDFPKIPAIPKLPNDVGNNRNVQSFSRDTPDGGRIEGHVETFAYNPPPVSNSISRTEESSDGFRRNENILNNNREVTGYRTQSFFRTNFRTITPNLESNSFNEHSRNEHRNNYNDHSKNEHRNNNNQWWNVLNVLGNRQNNNPPSDHINRNVHENINKIQDNINRAFGARLSGFRRQSSGEGTSNINNRQNTLGRENNVGHQNQNFGNPARNQNFINPSVNQNFNAPNQNFNKPLENRNFDNPVVNNRNQNFHSLHGNQNSNNVFQNNHALPNIEIIPFNRADGEHNQHNGNNYPIDPNPIFSNNPINANRNINPQIQNRVFNNNNHNINPQLNNDIQNKVMNLIQDVNSHLKDVHNNNQRTNIISPKWDDDFVPNFNHDWSSRRRPFSNGHSGPSNVDNHAGPKGEDIIKSVMDSLVGNTNFNNPRNRDNSYRNVNGGGVEKFFGFDRTVEKPNSFSRNQQRGYERDFKVNSNSGYTRANQWSTNTVRRLDAQSSKADFSTDFIDVFRDD